MTLIIALAATLALGILIGAVLVDVTVGTRLRHRIERAHSRTARERVLTSVRTPW